MATSTIPSSSGSTAGRPASELSRRGNVNGSPGVQATPSGRSGNLTRILGVSVPVSVTVAERQWPIESILTMTVGTIIEFDVPFDAELALAVGQRTIARGLAVKVGENFGLQVTGVDSVVERIDALGAH